MTWKIFYLAVIILFLGTSKAEAYLDPGTGSMIVQAIIASFVAVGVFWRNLFSFFKSFLKKGNELPEQE